MWIVIRNQLLEYLRKNLTLAIPHYNKITLFTIFKKEQ